MQEEKRDVTKYIQQKILGDIFDVPLLQNNFRSLFVEYLVLVGLGSDWRLVGGDWAAWDLENEKGVRLEVKQSAARQSWNAPSSGISAPRFDIKKRKGYWKDGTTWVSQLGRFADIYVFAWHPITDESCDHRDPSQWVFYVVPANQLPDQKSIGLSWLIKNSKVYAIEDLKDIPVAKQASRESQV